MEVQALRDENEFPDQAALKNVLGPSFSAFFLLEQKIHENNSGLAMEWRYYRDGKAWLCKVTTKKKTVCWLSVWNGYFKTTFYFTEKTGSAIAGLTIDQALKKKFHESKSIGKLIPLTLNIMEIDQLKDLTILIDYKKTN